MTAQPVHERRLATIIATDLAGYSRMMEADEEYTLVMVKTCLKIFDKVLERYGGRRFGLAGDGFMIEFASPVQALRAAADIQKTLLLLNADRPEARKMRFRMGINLGDVVVDGDRLAGDGVNIAARLEQLAEPGGVVISGSVFDHVWKQLPYAFADMGPQKVKNISERVRAYKVDTDPQAPRPIRRQTPKWVRPAALFGGIAVGSLLLGMFFMEALEHWAPEPALATKVDHIAHVQHLDHVEQIQHQGHVDEAIRHESEESPDGPAAGDWPDLPPPADQMDTYAAADAAGPLDAAALSSALTGRDWDLRLDGRGYFVTGRGPQDRFPLFDPSAGFSRPMGELVVSGDLICLRSREIDQGRALCGPMSLTSGDTARPEYEIAASNPITLRPSSLNPQFQMGPGGQGPGGGQFQQGGQRRQPYRRR